MTPRLIVPKKASLVDGRKVVVPFLFDSDGQLVDPVNCYLRNLAWRKKKGTVMASARALCVFWQYLAWRNSLGRIVGEVESVRLISLDISEIRQWLAQIESRNGFMTKARSTQPLEGTTVGYRDHLFKFLEWASANGWIPQRVSSTKAPSLDTSILSREQIPIDCPIRPFLPVPTTEDIEAVKYAISAHAAVSEARRDLLMFRWAAEVGLRNSEIRLLRKSALPVWTLVTEWKAKGFTPTMVVVGKGSKTRRVEPPISLLFDTHMYLRDKEAANERGGSGTARYIFTTKNATPLTQNWVSKRFSWFFKIAGLDSHLHRARAYYLFQLTRMKLRELVKHGKLDELHIRTILDFVLDRAGHEDLATLKHYVRLNLMDLGIPIPASLS